MKMKINFSLDENNYGEQELYYGNQKRYSSMTCIVFINENLLVCGSYCNRKLYLVEFDIEKNTYNIKQTIDSCGKNYGKKNRVFSVDLIDYNGKYIATSNFLSCSISLYKLDKDGMKHVKSILNSEYGFCHGVKFHPFYEDIIFFTTSGSTNKNCGIYAIKYEDIGETIKPFFKLTNNNLLVKDVCFSDIDKNKLFGLFSTNAPSPNEKKIYTSKVSMYNVNIETNEFEKLYELNFDTNCHADCIQYHNNKLYVTIQEIDNEGFIYEILIDENRLILNKKIDGYSFPHGLNIKYGLIGVKEYGNNCISISKF